jgi:hypothetical protein
MQNDYDKQTEANTMETQLIKTGEKGSKKLNFMKTKDNIFMHRQIEMRNGLVFMRLKIRPFICIRGARGIGSIA